MNRILKVTALVVLFLSTAISIAKTTETGLDKAKETKSVVLNLEKASKGLTVRFTDADNNVLYSEKLKDGAISKKFDMKNLEDGTYFITTSDLTKLVVYTVTLNADEVNITKTEEVLKPSFRKTSNGVALNFLNLDKSAVDVTVYDDNYRMIFNETFNDSLIVNKAFNFKSAYEGNYKVVVTDANRAFSEYITIE